MRDPIRNYHFKFKKGADTIAYCTDVTGMNATTDVIEFRAGDDARVKKLAGIMKYGNITLKRGVVKDARQLWEWFNSARSGTIRKESCTVEAYDYGPDAEEIVASWDLEEAWPVKWTGPDFTAKGNDVAFESIEIAVEEIRWAG